MKIKCVFCGKEATRLCDAPVGRASYIGHPPRHLMQQAHMSDTMWKRIDMVWTVTCDKPMCDKCAVKIGLQIDYCPCCVKEIKIAAKKEKA